MNQLSIEQRFALQRARYEVSRMSRPALERSALRLLKTRMEQKNGVQETLRANGIMFKIDEHQAGMPEIISEDTFITLLEMNMDECAQIAIGKHLIRLLTEFQLNFDWINGIENVHI